MLPYLSAEESLPPMARKVYINPNFQSRIARAVTQQQAISSLQGHIAYQAAAMSVAQPPAIHINPHFLQRQQAMYDQYQMALNNQATLQQQVPYYQQAVAAEATPQAPMPMPAPLPVPAPAPTPGPPAKIISKASTCIVRKPRVIPAVKKPAVPEVAARVQPPLVSMTKLKIVRQGASTSAKPSDTAKLTISVPPPAKRTRYKLVRSISLTSSSTPLVKTRRSRDFVGRYALQRTNTSNPGKKLSLSPHVLKPSVNKSLRLVSIHGVMYKKLAKNKLTKLDAADTATVAKPTLSLISSHKAAASGRTLFVRGTKFVLDPTGCRLTRIPVNTAQPACASASLLDKAATCRRIDIGGLTYVASPKAQHIYIRTTNHVSRAHLMTARHRSLQLLNRSLVKTNVPCAIYQRLGKCAAYGRGKCRKLHDKRQVAICPRFLRAECSKLDCLLSHNVTLEKMPVCRYYLRGVCVREDCPYLHKKLSRKAEICIDFLRGFCARAADCNKRHEFVCPELARKGSCELTSCAFCKQMAKINASKSKKLASPKSQTASVTAKLVDVEEPTNPSRYFKCEGAAPSPSPHANDHRELVQMELEEQSDEELAPTTLRQRPKLGALPAFIPLGKE